MVIEEEYGVITYVLERVDALRGLLDLTANDLWNQLVDQLVECAVRDLAGDDLSHLAANCADLGRRGIGGLFDLISTAFGESNREDADEVVVGGLDCDVGLDEGLPLADQGAQFVGGEVKTVEVGQAVLALNLIDPQAHLAESMLLVLLQVSKRNLKDAALQCIVRILQTRGAVHERLADTVS